MSRPKLSAKCRHITPNGSAVLSPGRVQGKSVRSDDEPGWLRSGNGGRIAAVSDAA